MVFLYLVFFVLGCAAGSFLNVVVDRTIRGESVVFGRSYCDFCHHTLSTFDLVPVLSFLGLRARCRYCHRKLPWQYPIVETLVGILFVLTFSFLVSAASLSPFLLFYYLAVISTLVVVAIVDLKFSLIPTTFVFAAAIVVLFRDYFYLSSSEFVISVVSAFLLGLGFFAIVVVSRGRGMGSGDIPLVFLLALFLGWPQSLFATFLSFLSGAIISVVLLALGKKTFGQTIPFAPFLIGSSIAVLFWGERIIDWYLRLL